MYQTTSTNIKKKRKLASFNPQNKPLTIFPLLITAVNMFTAQPNIWLCFIHVDALLAIYRKKISSETFIYSICFHEHCLVLFIWCPYLFENRVPCLFLYLYCECSATLHIFEKKETIENHSNEEEIVSEVCA